MQVIAYAPYGAEGIILRIEADIRRGIPGVDVIGLADGAVREARERVRAAFRNSGFPFPEDRVLVNLAPAGLRKEGASLDLPIAIAVMAAAGLVSLPDELMVLGELELSGRVRGVRGVLAATAAGLKEGVAGFIVPRENEREASILAGDVSAAVSSLGEAVAALDQRSRTGSLPSPGTRSSPVGRTAPRCGDFRDARGQGRYKRALEIAAAGGHNLLVFGPPGAGKTMLARRLPSILAPLSREESIEATRLHSLAGRLEPCPDGCLVSHPPFRAPHHTSSAEGLLGGGRQVRPGEITLAHLGFLFLDEAPEFRSNVLVSLREPLEEGFVTISRAEGSLRLPADFQLILAANPCPCGRLGLTSGGISTCLCSAEEVARHWRRLGSALLDRVELRVPLLPPASGSLLRGGEEGSGTIAARVSRAVEIQRARYRGLGVRRNARLGPELLEKYCALEGDALHAFTVAVEKLTLSARACHAIVRVARTIADLEGREAIAEDDLLEAVQHRLSGDDPYGIANYARGMPSI